MFWLRMVIVKNINFLWKSSFGFGEVCCIENEVGDNKYGYAVIVNIL